MTMFSEINLFLLALVALSVALIPRCGFAGTQPTSGLYIVGCVCQFPNGTRQCISRGPFGDDLYYQESSDTGYGGYYRDFELSLKPMCTVSSTKPWFAGLWQQHNLSGRNWPLRSLRQGSVLLFIGLRCMRELPDMLGGHHGNHHCQPRIISSRVVNDELKHDHYGLEFECGDDDRDRWNKRVRHGQPRQHVSDERGTRRIVAVDAVAQLMTWITRN
jgi:hypothetical protein